MEYLLEEDTENKPENLVEPDNAESSELSVDEEDDDDTSAEMQTVINQIKSSWENKDIRAEKPAE